jgi:cytosine/adenosine deaminase-related metal-dependent hydrolase
VRNACPKSAGVWAAVPVSSRRASPATRPRRPQSPRTRRRSRRTPTTSSSTSALLAADWIVHGDGLVTRHGAVLVESGTIRVVGPADALRSAHPDVAVLDLGPAILAPGFVDAHCHLEWALAGGLAPDGEFGRWLGAFLAAVSVADPDFTQVAADVGALTALRSGTTTLCDSGPTGAGAAAMRHVGLTGTSCVEAFGAGGPDAVDAAVARLRDSYDRVAGDRDGVGIGIAPHAPYSVGPALWRRLFGSPEFASVPWTTHVAESPAELVAITTGGGTIADAFAARFGSPAQWPGAPGEGAVARVARGGGLRAGMIAAHCVQLTPGEPRILADHGVAVAHCPTSNANLGCGIAPLEALWDAGVRVGLGTDSPASAGSYDLRAEARACGLVHRAAGAAIRPRDLVRLMTLGGAEALGRDHEIGTLAPGKRADVVAIDVPTPIKQGRHPSSTIS